MLLGFQTGDNNRFLRFIWEPSVNALFHKWVPCTKGGPFRKWNGNIEYCVNWENDAAEMHKCKGAIFRNEPFYFKSDGTTWSTVSAGKPSFRFFEKKYLFETKGSVCFPKDCNLFTLMGFLNSNVAYYYLSALSPTLDYHEGPVGRLPFVLSDNKSTSLLVQDNVSISKHDWDSHETSLDFKTNELYRLALGLTYDQVESSLMTEASLNLRLEEVISRYIQFWQEKFMQLHTNEEELNRKFIEIYGLQDELTPDVPLDEITILQKGEISIEDNQIVWHKDVIIKQFISWMVGCFMGRYSADKPGLIIASQGQKVADLDLPAMTLEIDDDGIIPIIQEADFFADDMTQRIEAGVKTLFGEQHFYDNMKYIKVCLGQELRDYLYRDYYDDHLQMYSVKGAKRPIYWLFSSKMGDKKKKGYFKALVYMHRMESDTLSKLHADYVSPYIDKVEQQLKEAEDDAVRDDLSQAQRNKANKLAAELADKVREVKEFATILAQMSTQRLIIDLDDGVKVNYPKYYPLVEPIKGLESKDE